MTENGRWEFLKLKTNEQDDRIKELEESRLKQAEAIAHLEGQVSLLIKLNFGVWITVVANIVLILIRGG